VECSLVVIDHLAELTSTRFLQNVGPGTAESLVCMVQRNEMEEIPMASTTMSQTPLRAKGPVRISLPASVAYNAQALKKTIASVVQQLGCRTCFSGADCQFKMERDLVVSEDGALRENPVPSPWLRDQSSPSPSDIVVAFQGDVAFDIEQVNASVDLVISTLRGCPYCHSGRDVSYLDEVTLIGITQDLQVQQYGGGGVTAE